MSYLALMRLPPARRLVYALTAACLSFGMISLTLLIIVQRASGSYPAGGFAVAAFALMAGVSAPFRGRLVDRRGARPWLPALASGYAVFLVVLDVTAHHGAPTWLLVALSGAVGLSAPPLFASARARWPQAVEPSLLRRGYALASLLSDIGQVGGPALAGLLFLVSGWSVPVVCGAFAVVAAILSLPPRGGVPRVRPKPMPRLLESRALTGLLGVSILLGCSVGLVQVAVPTAAGRWHAGFLAGPLLAAFAFGSVIGALWFGSRSWRIPVIDRYLGAVFALGALLAPLCFAGRPAVLAPLLVVAGLAFGPATVSVYETLDAVVPDAGAEALTWVTTAEAGGSAAGSAAAGVLAVHVGLWAPFALASVLIVAPVGLMVGLRAAGVGRPA